jgi:DNA N-6-adenine-methyltransferase (Dam)
MKAAKRDVRRSLGSHQSAKMLNDEWLTPRWILEALGHFDMDPCAPIDSPWRTADLMLNKHDDGLPQGWHGRVWLNPPFGAQAVKWMRRMANHGNGIALLAARTETKMFFETVWDKADAVCFLRSRPHFCYVDGTPAKANSGAPICLIAYGARNRDVLDKANLGATVTGWRLGPLPARKKEGKL